MSKNRHYQLYDEKFLSDLFCKTVKYISDALGKKAFRPKRAINASVLDSVMVGVANMLQTKRKIPSITSFLEAYDELLSDSDYNTATTDATSDEAVVETRMNLAIKKFSNIND